MLLRPAAVFRWTIVTALVFLGDNHGVKTFELDDAVSILKLGREIVKEILFTWNALAPDKTSEMEGVEFPLLRGKERKVMERIGEVSRQLERLELQQRASATATIHTLMRDLPSLLRLELRLDRMAELVSQIDIADMQLNSYVESGFKNDSGTENEWQLERHTLENFATWAVSHHPFAVRGVLERIHAIVAPSNSSNRALQGRGLFLQLRGSMTDVSSVSLTFPSLLLLHDNARPHCPRKQPLFYANFTGRCWKIRPIVRTDEYHLFIPFKKHLKGIHPRRGLVWQIGCFHSFDFLSAWLTQAAAAVGSLPQGSRQLLITRRLCGRQERSSTFHFATPYKFLTPNLLFVLFHAVRLLCSYNTGII